MEKLLAGETDRTELIIRLLFFFFSFSSSGGADRFVPARACVDIFVAKLMFLLLLLSLFVLMYIFQ